jgi:hypothetical protein
MTQKTTARYGAMVTNLSLQTAEIWRSYRGRADCENRIKEIDSAAIGFRICRL